MDADVRAEIESHIAMRAELNRQAGMPEDEAARAARRQFGNATSIREQVYHFNGFGLLDALGRDLRSSVRTLGRYPGVTCLALISLALGIGANTMAFSFVNVLVFNVLPYPNPDRLVMTDDGITPEECQVLRQHAQDVFEELGCFSGDEPSGASIADDNPGSLLPEYVIGQQFTAGMGPALDIRPLLGRWFSDADELGTAGRVALISHRLWQRRFAGSADVLDKPIRIDGETATIVGVMPDEFEFLSTSVNYWIPFRSPESALQSGARILGAIGRLRQNVTVEQAQSRVDALVVQRIPLTRMDQNARSQFQDSALLLQGTVGFVLLIACANVAGLLLTQAVSQQRELAVRAALGSGTWRIVRQTLIHSVLLFSAGGLLGLATGWAGVRVMVNLVMPYSMNAYGPPRGGFPRGIAETSVDGTVLFFTFAISVVCGLVVAIVPALQISRAQPLDVLREWSLSATPSPSRQRLRSVFVTIQIALAFILLVGSALMLNGLTRALGQDIGFDTADLLTVRLRLPQTAQQMRFNSEQMRQHLAGIAGVTAASGIAIYPPLSGAVNMPLRVEGQSQKEKRSQFLPIMPDYFKTLQVAIVQGREFGPNDSAEAMPIAIVNEAAVRQFWPGESAIGKAIQIQSPQLPNEPSRHVIGVVSEVMQYPGQADRPQLYVPFGQLQIVKDERLANQLRDITFIVKTSRPAAEIASDATAAITRADRTQAVSSIRTMQQTAFGAAQRRSVFIAVMALFGSIAVVLAVIGVYGVMANVVSQRFNEFGIRIALGADSGQIRRLVIRHGGVLIGIGLVLGIVVSIAVTRVIQSFLFGTSATDPVTFMVGVVLLGGVAFLACYIPAWRASRIDAIVALRHH